VVDELIDWNNVPEDPMFTLTFPRKGMLTNATYKEVLKLLNKADNEKLEKRYTKYV